MEVEQKAFSMLFQFSRHSNVATCTMSCKKKCMPRLFHCYLSCTQTIVPPRECLNGEGVSSHLLLSNLGTFGRNSGLCSSSLFTNLSPLCPHSHTFPAYTMPLKLREQWNHSIWFDIPRSSRSHSPKIPIHSLDQAAWRMVQTLLIGEDTWISMDKLSPNPWAVAK